SGRRPDDATELAGVRGRSPHPAAVHLRGRRCLATARDRWDPGRRAEHRAHRRRRGRAPRELRPLADLERAGPPLDAARGDPDRADRAGTRACRAGEERLRRDRVPRAVPAPGTRTHLPVPRLRRRRRDPPRPGRRPRRARTRARRPHPRRSRTHGAVRTRVDGPTYEDRPRRRGDRRASGPAAPFGPTAPARSAGLAAPASTRRGSAAGRRVIPVLYYFAASRPDRPRWAGLRTRALEGIWAPVQIPFSLRKERQ